MTWSYTGDPNKSDLDKIRFIVGDTDKNDQLLTDEEIQYLIDNESDANMAAFTASETIAAKFSRLADESVGQVSVSYSQKAEHYWKLAKTLKLKANKLAVPYAGGISQSDKTNVENDTDRVEPFFNRELHNE